MISSILLTEANPYDALQDASSSKDNTMTRAEKVLNNDENDVRRIQFNETEISLIYIYTYIYTYTYVYTIHKISLSLRIVGCCGKIVCAELTQMKAKSVIHVHVCIHIYIFIYIYIYIYVCIYNTHTYICLSTYIYV